MQVSGPIIQILYYWFGPILLLITVGYYDHHCLFQCQYKEFIIHKTIKVDHLLGNMVAVKDFFWKWLELSEKIGTLIDHDGYDGGDIEDGGMET